MAQPTVYKNTGLCEVVRRRIGADALPGAGRSSGEVSFGEASKQAPVNGGRNYNGPKVAEIPCRVSSDLHEWRNELGAVSTRDSVKL